MSPVRKQMSINISINVTQMLNCNLYTTADTETDVRSHSGCAPELYQKSAIQCRGNQLAKTLG